MNKKYALVVGIVLAILLAVGVLYYFSSRQKSPEVVKNTKQEIIVGGDRDEHGCIPSAGYTWCESANECYRPWEKECEGEEDFRYMSITSPAFVMEEEIPSKYTCDGENISPTLMWSEYPEGTQSMVIMVDDPDAPGGDFVHWLVWNINPKDEKIGEDSAPKGAVIGMNSLNENKYNGPCPPSGTHGYHFELYALGTILDLNASSRREDVKAAMEDHVLDEALLYGTYSKK